MDECRLEWKKGRKKEKRLHTPQPLHPHPEQSPLQFAQLEQEHGAILSFFFFLFFDVNDDDVVVISV